MADKSHGSGTSCKKRAGAMPERFPMCISAGHPAHDGCLSRAKAIDFEKLGGFSGKG